MFHSISYLWFLSYLIKVNDILHFLHNHYIISRNFLKYMSLLGVMSFSGLSLFVHTSKIQLATLGSTHMDAYFDPDGWL